MIGIDVGGANLKVVDDEGVFIWYCPLWEGALLSRLLKERRKERNERAAVVMSGELADCFENKMQGITFIVDTIRQVFPHALFYGTDAAFHVTPVPQLAAANWLASADYLRDDYPHAVLLDVGSTTADIIPLSRFEDLKGLADLQRLQKGYLIYNGLLRTNVATLLHTLSLDGVITPVSAEYFAISADVHLVLGHITPDQYTCDTPDRKEKTASASLRRLARVICADLGEIGESGAIQIAEQFWERQKTMICDLVQRAASGCSATEVITAGIGAPLFAKVLDSTDLTKELGAVADALPAFAVREVAKRNNCFDTSSRSLGEGWL